MRAITACIQNNTRTTLNKQQFEVAGNSRDDNKVAGCADAPAARTRLGLRPPRGTQAALSQPYSVAPSVYHYRGMPPLILHSISFTLLLTMSTFRHIYRSLRVVYIQLNALFPCDSPAARIIYINCLKHLNRFQAGLHGTQNTYTST